MPVDGLGAMMSYTYRDTLGVDVLPHIVRMHPIHFKGHRADAVRSVLGARMRTPSTSASRSSSSVMMRSWPQSSLCRCPSSIPPPHPLRPLGPPAASRPRTVPEAHVLGRPVHEGQLDHGTAELGRRQCLQQIALAVQEATPVGPYILWALNTAKSTSNAWKSTGMCGTDWHASRMKTPPTSWVRLIIGQYRLWHR